MQLHLWQLLMNTKPRSVEIPSKNFSKFLKGKTGFPTRATSRKCVQPGTKTVTARPQDKKKTE
jgi:hypothetical protein